VLVDLTIENLAVIEHQELALGPGLTAITGESGAGKSLLLRAIDLAAGARGEASLVRLGQDSARIALRVRNEGEEHILVRELRRDGRSLATIDGRTARLADLRELVASWLGVGRQGDAYRLRQAGALAWLDRLDAVQPALLQTAEAARKVETVRAGLAALGGLDAQARERRLEYLRYALAEIEAADVRPGERDALRRERDRLRNVQRLRESVVGAHERLLPDAEGPGAYDLLAGAAGALDQAAALDPAFDAVARELANLADGAREQARSLARALDDLVADPAREEEVGERLDLLSELDRKYGGDEDAVLAFADRARAELARLEGDAGRLDALRREEGEAEAAWRRAAGELSAARAEAARALERSAAAELTRLALPEARLFLRVVPDPDLAVSAAGMDRMEALFAADAGAPLLPLGDVASGGEASRVLLALEAALAQSRGGGTWLFDEVEAGVGGIAAWNVAASLRALSRAGQVVLVSHLAPVAAVADVQLAVAKESGSDGEAVSRARPVRGEERVLELARMLSGEGPAAERHARDLLARARALDGGPTAGAQASPRA
jgi:DNA repair protein RecN (Recombination protein N)